MASSYPGGLDSLPTNKLAGDFLTGHATLTNDTSDAVNKIEAELGTNPSSGFSTVAARIASLGVNVKDHGAIGDGVADDTAAITAALAAADALTPASATVYFPPGTYNTTGGHTIPVGCQVMGAGVRNTTIVHSGNNTAFLYNGGDGTSRYVDYHPGVSDLLLRGNSGASAVGFEVRGCFSFRFENLVVGGQAGDSWLYSGANAVGIRLHNFAANQWCEGVVMRDVHIGFAKTAIQFARTSGTNSFGYLMIEGVHINLPADGVAFDIGGHGTSAEVLIYNAVIRGNIWFQGNNATAVYLRPTATVNRGVFAHIVMEGMGAGDTGYTRIKTDAGATGGTQWKTHGYFDMEMNVAAAKAVDAFNGGNPVVQIGGVPTPVVDPAPTVAASALHMSHAGVGFVQASNRETTWLSGYSNANSPLVMFSRKPFNSNETATFDADANCVGFFAWDGTWPYLGLGTPTTHIKVLSGTGSPEGAVPAPTGSLFLRQNGGASTTMYVKESGTGNTGWIAK